MVYIFLANGFEECEALVPLDILLRGDIEVKTVGIGGLEIKGTHNITVIADITDSEVVLKDIDAVILPGGMPGTDNLESNETVNKAIEYANENGKLVCAICAAPKILGVMGLLKGKSATCFPSFEKNLIGAEVTTNSVVKDGNIITAKGAGVAFEFGFTVLESLIGTDKTEALKNQMQYGG
ncbi:MAG: DJ-1/PfpI family protein [Clostridia bacterium]|nr:DJ-1/PfpI family protein [Clostridia bacterium]